MEEICIDLWLFRPRLGLECVWVRKVFPSQLLHLSPVRDLFQIAKVKKVFIKVKLVFWAGLKDRVVRVSAVSLMQSECEELHSKCIGMKLFTIDPHKHEIPSNFKRSWSFSSPSSLRNYIFNAILLTQTLSVSGIKASQSTHPLTGVATRLQVSRVCRLQAVCCAAAEDPHPSSHCWGLFKCVHRQVCACWLDYDYVIHLLCQYQLHMREFTACRGCCWFDIRQRTDKLFFMWREDELPTASGLKLTCFEASLVGLPQTLIYFEKRRQFQRCHFKGPVLCKIHFSGQRFHTTIGVSGLSATLETHS